VTKYLVRYQGFVDAGVTVDVDDPDDAWDVSYEELPSGLCAHCSGYGRRGFFMELDGPTMQPYVIEDENGVEVATELTQMDMLQREVNKLREDNRKLREELRRND
jgi:protein tyrosine phosphatase